MQPSHATFVYVHINTMPYYLVSSCVPYNRVILAPLIYSIYQQVECYEGVPPENVKQYAFQSSRL